MSGRLFYPRASIARAIEEQVWKAPDLFLTLNEGVSLYPETIDALEKLSQNYRLGIIANQSSSIRELLKEWGIESYFQLIILSEEVGLSKPNTAIFTLALQKQKSLQIELSMSGIGMIMIFCLLNLLECGLYGY